MQYRGICAIGLLMIVCGLLGCSAENDFSRQNRWLEANYPDRADHLQRLPDTQALVRDAVLAGQVELGMRLDEVLIASDTTPYGPKAYKGKFWCNGQVVPRCDADCSRCDGIVLLADKVARFSGASQPPTVSELNNAATADSIFTPTPSMQLRIAEALYRDEIITGMSLRDVSLVLGSLSSQVSYYCDNTPAGSVAHCSTACNNCRIELGNSANPTLVKTIFFEQALGEQRVSRVDH